MKLRQNPSVSNFSPIMIVFVLVFSFQSIAQPNVRTYGELTTLESGQGSASLLNAKVFQNQIYVGGEMSRYSLTGSQWDRVSPLVGVELPWKGQFALLRGFAEYRYTEENPVSTLGPNDPRFGLIGGAWYEYGKSKGQSIFTDGYFESISVPRVAWSPTSLTKIKNGLRLKFSNQVAVDPFFEFFARASSDSSVFGRAALELREGARIVLIGQGWSGQLSFVRAFYSVVSAPEPTWMGLLNFGGEF
jgi:hypothetical protein